MPDALFWALFALAVCFLCVLSFLRCDDDHVVEHRLRRGAALPAVVGHTSSASGDGDGIGDEELYHL